MPEPRAFLAIERTMAAAMRAVWAKRATALAATLQPLVDEGKWGDAQTAINGLTLQGVVGDVRPRIGELAVSAVLFGAHHAAGSVKATTFMNGNALPKEMGLAIDQLVDMVEANGRDQVCNQLHAAIEALKQADERLKRVGKSRGELRPDGAHRPGHRSFYGEERLWQGHRSIRSEIEFRVFRRHAIG